MIVPCRSDGCGNHAVRRGLCRRHYDSAERVQAEPGTTARLPAVAVPAQWAGHVEALAQASGRSVAQWVRDAVRDEVLRQTERRRVLELRRSAKRR